MILLQRKRILLVITMVFISIFTYTFTTSNIEHTVQTVSLPVTNKVVILDAGHRTEKMLVHSLIMEQQKQILT